MNNTTTMKILTEIIINVLKRRGRPAARVMLPGLMLCAVMSPGAVSAQNTGHDRTVYGTTQRDILPDGMVVVSDPRSDTRISPVEMARIAARRGTEDSVALVVVNFRVNSTRLEENYMDNARTLEIMRRTFSDRRVLADMDFITITAAASPEGNTAANARLAEGRSLAIKNYIVSRYPFLDRGRIFTFSIGEDWEGLRMMVAEDPFVPYRDEVLDILDSGRGSDSKRSRLYALGGGRAYSYIAANMLPSLRGAATSMTIYYKEDPQPIVIRETQTDTVYIDRPYAVEVEKIVEQTVEVPVVSPREPYYWSVKTNVLYDAALLPDLSVEFTLDRRFSVEVGGQWSWWTSDISHKNCWRIQVIGIEPRMWLGDRATKTPLSGHFIGVYGMGGSYDVRFGGKTGYLSDRSWSAGLSYGYAMPLGRSWNLEFSLSVGYINGNYETYHIYNRPSNEFYRDSRATKHYFGPTKARISFVWLPGGKNPGNK